MPVLALHLCPANSASCFVPVRPDSTAWACSFADEATAWQAEMVRISWTAQMRPAGIYDDGASNISPWNTRMAR
jgi:hypothetical protein